MYVVILLYLLLLVYIYDFQKRKTSKMFFYWVSCIVLILVAGLRYRIGVDTIGYMRHFQTYPTIDDYIWNYDYEAEILWMIINSICKSLYNDFVLVQLIQASILNLTVFWFIKKYSPFPFLGCLLFYVFQWWNLCFEAMREAIAVAFYLYALDAIISESNYKKYYYRVWPAFFVHTFGFMTLLFPFIQLLNVKKNTFFILMVLISIALYFSTHLNMLTLLLNGNASDKIEMYLESEIFGVEASFNYILFSVIGIFIPCIVVIKYLKESNVEIYKRFVPYILILAVLVILRMKIAIFFRLFNYFEIPFIVGVTQVLSIIKKKQRWILILTICLIIMYKIRPLMKPVFYYREDIKSYNRYYPYNSIFSKDYNEKSEWIFREKGH